MNLVRFIDSNVIDLISSIRHPFLDAFFFFFTYFGEWWVVLSILLIASLSFSIKGKVRYILALWPALLGAGASSFLLKFLTQRSRPVSMIVQESSSSFPSAHAAIAIAFYGLILYLVWKNIKKKSMLPVLIFGDLFIILIGFSRLYLGAHYLSDVIAGYLLGAFWMYLPIYLYSKIK
ncbi:phosphatase PAP2 family protein [Candidatus Parcubacteria bacterium]|nr:MAG: phosphatase PAP2 family protein [Candidatus Parcubacteria bacterium]